jgi:hypothetical protein
MKRKHAALSAALCLASLPVIAAEFGVPAPMQTGDTWTYRSSDLGLAPQPLTYQIGFKNRDGSLVVLVARRPAQPGAQVVWQPLYPVGADVCVYDVVANGRLGLDRGCDADFSPGHSWTAKSADSLSTVQDDYTVAAIEEIEVPAGRFKAVKIENRRTITEVAYPGVPAPPNGYVRNCVNVFWYAPAVRGIVKATRRTTNENGKLLVDSREELEQFKAGGAKG